MLMSLVILTHTVLEEQAEEPGQVLCNSLRVLLEAWCGSLPLCASDPASCSPEARASTGLWWWKPKLCTNLPMLLVSPADTHQVGQCSVGQLSLRREEKYGCWQLRAHLRQCQHRTGSTVPRCMGTGMEGAGHCMLSALASSMPMGM